MPEIKVAAEIHSQRHAAGGPDPITPGDIGAAPLAAIEGMSATVTGLPSGADPTVTVTGDLTGKTINLGIPRGADGPPGDPGMGYEEGQQLLAQNQTTLDAAQAAQSSAASSASDADAAVTLAQQAQAAALEVPDANVSALLANPATETGAYVTALPRYIPGAGAVGPIGSMNVALGTPGNVVADDLSGCTVMGGTSGASGAGSGYANVIGDGIIANIGTGTPNYDTGDLTKLRGTNASISTVGSYDNVAAGLASVIWGFHCYTTGSATHGTISGGSFHGIDAGDYSTIGGGTNNKITGGTRHTIPGGANNTVGGVGNNTAAGAGNTIDGTAQASTALGSANNVSGAFATAIGTQNTVSNERSTAIGAGNQITSSRSTAIGENNSVSGLGSFAGGVGSTATAAYSFAYGQGAQANAPGAVAWGRDSNTTANGQMTNAYGSFAAPGDAQTSVLIHRRETGSAGDADCTADGTTSSAQYYNIPVGGSVAFSMQVVGRNVATGATRAWRIDGAARDGGASSVLIGTPTVTDLGGDTGTETWQARANVSARRLTTRVNGQASTTIRWVSRITLTEVGTGA